MQLYFCTLTILNDLLFHCPQVEYSAVIYYQTSGGDFSYIDSLEITTSDNSYVFTMLTPSTKYKFTVTSYTKKGKSSDRVVTWTTMDGRNGIVIAKHSVFYIVYYCRKPIFCGASLYYQNRLHAMGKGNSR